MRTQLAESKRWGDLSKQGDNIKMLDPSFGIWIVFGPKSHEFFQMVRSKNRPISCEVVEVVHDDSDEKIDNEERTEHEERDEVRVGKVVSAPRLVESSLAVVVGHWVASHVFPVRTRQHDVLPGFSRRRSEQKTIPK